MSRLAADGRRGLAAQPLWLALLLTTMIVAPSFGGVSAEPDARPLPRTGTCPAGYYVSGAYCVPTRGARFALPRQGTCPGGYMNSGDYCLATPGSRYAVPKEKGTCPGGYYASGDYCLDHH
ncbi:MAG: hypothetical protein U1E42_02995 [Rhodospirillales bacterium]